jgi:translation initiation factor 5A
MDEHFEGTSDNAEKTYPIRAGEIKKGMIVLLKNFPCKVIEVTTSKTGKHGHAKANITGLDIFTGKKYQDISPCSHNMVAPFVTVTKLNVIDIAEDGAVTLMDDNGETREDLNLPTDQDAQDALKNDFEAGKEIVASITKAMDKEVITSHICQ